MPTRPCPTCRRFVVPLIAVLSTGGAAFVLATMCQRAPRWKPWPTPVPLAWLAFALACASLVVLAPRKEIPLRLVKVGLFFAVFQAVIHWLSEHRVQRLLCGLMPEQLALPDSLLLGSVVALPLAVLGAWLVESGRGRRALFVVLALRPTWLVVQNLLAFRRGNWPLVVLSIFVAYMVLSSGSRRWQPLRAIGAGSVFGLCTWGCLLASRPLGLRGLPVYIALGAVAYWAPRLADGLYAAIKRSARFGVRTAADADRPCWIVPIVTCCLALGWSFLGATDHPGPRQIGGGVYLLFVRRALTLHTPEDAQGAWIAGVALGLIFAVAATTVAYGLQRRPTGRAAQAGLSVAMWTAFSVFLLGVSMGYRSFGWPLTIVEGISYVSCGTPFQGYRTWLAGAIANSPIRVSPYALAFDVLVFSGLMHLVHGVAYRRAAQLVFFSCFAFTAVATLLSTLRVGWPALALIGISVLAGPSLLLARWVKPNLKLERWLAFYVIGGATFLVWWFIGHRVLSGPWVYTLVGRQPLFSALSIWLPLAAPAIASVFAASARMAPGRRRTWRRVVIVGALAIVVLPTIASSDLCGLLNGEMKGRICLTVVNRVGLLSATYRPGVVCLATAWVLGLAWLAAPRASRAVSKNSRVEALLVGGVWVGLSALIASFSMFGRQTGVTLAVVIAVQLAAVAVAALYWWKTRRPLASSHDLPNG